MRPLHTFKEFCREQMDAPMDQHGHLLSTFRLSMTEFIDDLTDITAFDTVEVTQDDNDPTRVLLNFKQGGEVTDETGRAPKFE